MVQRLLASLACCCALALAGCSDDSSSSAGPDPSPSVSSSESSPSPTETDDAETPEAFVRRWVDVDREMQNSGHTGEYRRLSSKCRPCLEVADQVEGYYAAGGYVKTDGWTIRSSKTSRSPGSASVTIKVTSSPTEYVESAGGKVQHLEGGEGSYILSLMTARDSWVVADLEAVAQ
jgi:hypothetical protein